MTVTLTVNRLQHKGEQSVVPEEHEYPVVIENSRQYIGVSKDESYKIHPKETVHSLNNDSAEITTNRRKIVGRDEEVNGVSTVLTMFDQEGTRTRFHGSLEE